MGKGARRPLRILALLLAISAVLVCCACGHLAGHVCSDPAECPVCCLLCLLRLQLLCVLLYALQAVFSIRAAFAPAFPDRSGDPFLTLVSQNVQLND